MTESEERVTSKVIPDTLLTNSVYALSLPPFLLKKAEYSFSPGYFSVPYDDTHVKLTREVRVES